MFATKFYNSMMTRSASAQSADAAACCASPASTANFIMIALGAILLVVSIFVSVRISRLAVLSLGIICIIIAHIFIRKRSGI